ncbi:MAG: hypothetical protein LBD82_05870 [Deltaproteobacteria bacterium]|jgi:NitT/TauT family transport system substrate-binding protein|nr:hypothetical protein [Deltaproteobacteria bacterium]
MRLSIFALAFFLFLPATWINAQHAAAPRELTLYTALSATTPQMPLWGAIRQGWPGPGYRLKVEYWKNMDDLRGLLLAGKGDLWIGHLEGFAQAARRGAPLTLLAVTGWKKFYFIGREEPAGTGREKMLETVAEDLRRNGAALAMAPQDSPASGLLAEIARRGGPEFKIAPLPAPQLMLEISRGKWLYALLPEPLVSVLLLKNPSWRVLTGLEEELARRFGGLPRLPLAGLSASAALAEQNPELLEDLLDKMRAAAAAMEKQPEEALAALPQEVLSALGPEVIRASLGRDLLLALPAREIEPEIDAFLRLVLPAAAGSPEDAVPEYFIFKGAAR